MTEENNFYPIRYGKGDETVTIHYHCDDSLVVAAHDFRGGYHNSIRLSKDGFINYSLFEGVVFRDLSNIGFSDDDINDIICEFATGVSETPSIDIAPSESKWYLPINAALVPDLHIMENAYEGWDKKNAFMRFCVQEREDSYILLHLMGTSFKVSRVVVNESEESKEERDVIIFDFENDDVVAAVEPSFTEYSSDVFFSMMRLFDNKYNLDDSIKWLADR